MTESNVNKVTEHGRELRLAVVCYGGVSLAVYMHGVTKELRKLVVASRAFESNPDVNPFDPRIDTEYAYFEELARKRRQGDPLRVVLDVISGTSAGGINGVVLAKAVAGNLNDDALLDVWRKKGDIRGLLAGPAWLPLSLKLAWFGARLLRRSSATPLRGDQMARWLYDTLDAMGRTRDQRAGVNHLSTLVPPGSAVHLAVTMTDLQGRTWGFPSDRGTPAYDRTYRTVMRFTHDPTGEERQLDPAFDGALAFAARCTSSFPGAFPPVSIPAFKTWLEPKALGSPRRFDADQLTKTFFSDYPNDGAAAASTCFIDGGVLDNAPFDHAIDVIGGLPAERQVDRRILYLEPDPASTPPPDAAPPDDGAQPPSWLGTLLTTQRTIRGHQDLLGQIRRVQEINDRIDDIGAITERQLADAEKQTEAMLPQTSLDECRYEDLRQRARDLNQVAQDQAGASSYTTYRQLKLRSAVRVLAVQAEKHYSYPPDSGHLSQIQRGLDRWVDSQPDALKETELFAAIDLPYRERRIQFVLAGLNGLYSAATPTRAQLDTVKGELWQVLTDVRKEAVDAWTEAGKAVGGVDAVFGTAVLDALARDPSTEGRWQEQVGTLVDSYRTVLKGRLDKFDSSGRLWSIFTKYAGQANERAAWLPLLARYLAFPLFDVQIFPVMELSRLPQLSPITLQRLSPRDARALKVPPQDGSTEKLRGTRWAHFSGFFKEPWRENDYLWGRLDAAELLIGILREAKPAGLRATGHRAQPLTLDDTTLRTALSAVLTSEEKRLPGIAALRQELGKQLRPST